MVVMADGALSELVITINIQKLEVHKIKLSSVHLTPACRHSSLQKIFKAFLVDRLENEHHSVLDENILNTLKTDVTVRLWTCPSA